MRIDLNRFETYTTSKKKRIALIQLFRGVNLSHSTYNCGCDAISKSGDHSDALLFVRIVQKTAIAITHKQIANAAQFNANQKRLDISGAKRFSICSFCYVRSHRSK